MPGRTERVGGIPSSGGPSRCLLCLLAPLGLLVLPQGPLVAPDDCSTVLTGGRGVFPDPVGGSFSHLFPATRIYDPSLLVTGECRGSRDKPSFQAAEQQGLPTEVLRLEVRGASVPGHEIQDRDLGDCGIVNSLEVVTPTQIANLLCQC
jgi:hypothetical protein